MPTTMAQDTRLHTRCDQDMPAVQAHEAITLTQNDFAAFLGALEVPAPAHPVLQRALQRHAEQVQP